MARRIVAITAILNNPCGNLRIREIYRLCERNSGSQGKKQIKKYSGALGIVRNFLDKAHNVPPQLGALEFHKCLREREAMGGSEKIVYIGG